jgi:photosystem I P700 chlorophyll a apoprotein A2
MGILFSKIYISWLNFFKAIKNMATQFPKFNQDLINDPSTRRIWYGIATSHDLQNHDEMTEDNLYNKIFASHFGHLAIIFVWTSSNLFHVAWQGNF